MKKERIQSLDFIRAICALLIVFYHYVVQLSYVPNWDHDTFQYISPNGLWCQPVVFAFCMLSGFSLFYNYGEVHTSNLRTFFYKRWRSIYPVFYICYFWFWINEVFEQHTVFYRDGLGPRSRYLFTLLGLDGYLSQLERFSPTYYIVGDWFVGAIVIMYIAYPLLAWAMKRIPWIATVLLTVLFIWNLTHTFTSLDDYVHPITCIYEFWIGMLMSRYYPQIKKIKFLGIFSAILFFVFLLEPAPDSYKLVMQTIAGVMLFLTLDWVAPYLMRFKVVNKIILFFSGISFEMFLIHHTMIGRRVEDLILPGHVELRLNAWGEVGVFLFILLEIVILACLAHMVQKRLFNTPLFHMLDNFFLKKAH